MPASLHLKFVLSLRKCDCCKRRSPVQAVVPCVDKLPPIRHFATCFTCELPLVAVPLDDGEDGHALRAAAWGGLPIIVQQWACHVFKAAAAAAVSYQGRMQVI